MHENEVKVTMDEAMKEAFNGIKIYIKSIEDSFKNEINQLLINIKEDIVRIERGVSELKGNWLDDHDRIIRVEQALHQQVTSLKEFREHEASFGRATNKKIDDIDEALNKRIDVVDDIIINLQNTLSKLNLSVGKIMGVAAGCSLIMGAAIGVVLKFLGK